MIESDKEYEEVINVSISKILSTLKILQTYEEQQKVGDSIFTKTLRKRERDLQLRKFADLHQNILKD